MESPDYYSLLGVSRSATHQEIRSAYLEQAAFFRPDAGNVSPEIAQSKSDQLDEAYAILSDAARKRKYDAVLDRDKKYFIIDAETGKVIGETRHPPDAEAEFSGTQGSKGACKLAARIPNRRRCYNFCGFPRYSPTYPPGKRQGCRSIFPDGHTYIYACTAPFGSGSGHDLFRVEQ